MDEQLISTFVDVDDFCKAFETRWRVFLKQHRLRRRMRRQRLALSELMTIAIAFHFSQIRTFKAFYFMTLRGKWHHYFPKMPSYQRLVLLIQDTALPLQAFLSTRRTKECATAYVDSTVIEVCHFKRRYGNRIFKTLATTGKTTTGWFYGMKLHLMVNAHGEILAHCITTGYT